MTEQHYDLRLAIACYLAHDRVIVPPFYHDHIVNAYFRSRLEWNVEQAAALTLFSAYYDDILKLEDFSYPGKVALVWAENHIDDLKINPSISSG